MSTCCYLYRITFIFIWIRSTNSMSMINKHSYFMDNRDANNDVVDIIVSKGYIPEDKYLPKTSLVKTFDNDVTYLLSKLSDEELVKLLNEHPKTNEYDLNDVVKLAFDSKFIQDRKIKPDIADTRAKDAFYDIENQNKDYKKRFSIESKKRKPQVAVFRLENKQVNPYSMTDEDPNYYAIQKLSSMLYNRPSEMDRGEKVSEEDEKKELLFDILVSQLKTLCCKKTKKSVKRDPKKLVSNEFLTSNSMLVSNQDRKTVTNEHMFLIINDEIKGNGSDELISVDPESLEKNSSVLLLGPITTPLSDSQLKLVMFRISTELSKPEYVPLLQQLSDGTLSGSNIKLMRSLVSGPETRRYIKPHRCNHQSKLAKIYGGPKWLICTGYLNLNTPSLYD